MALAGTRRPERKSEKEKWDGERGQKRRKKRKRRREWKRRRKGGRRERKREKSKITLIKRTLKSSDKFLVMFPSSTCLLCVYNAQCLVYFMITFGTVVPNGQTSLLP